MTRCLRRIFLTSTVIFLFLFSTYFFFVRYSDPNHQQQSNIKNEQIQSQEKKKNDDFSELNSPLDDYEISRLLLPNSKRTTNAVESGNLSYDRVRSLALNRSNSPSANAGQNGKFRAFDAEGKSSADVIIFLHIQKTGGTTFERYLVRELDVPRPCQCHIGRKRCYCRRPNDGFWLFSRFSTGWPCGLHADYTELVVSGCVQRVLDREEEQTKISSETQISKERRYFLTTFLRDPLERYYSEYRHVTQRGATWGAALHVCDGRRATDEELKPCYDLQTGWIGASLDEFLACPTNLANNRQTRMLADLTLVNCYNRSGMSNELREATTLRSAKVNLKRLAFFGLQEDMRKSQYVFERTFGLEFKKPLLNWNETSDLSELTDEQTAAMRRVNNLDLELYEYAKKLFRERFEELKADDRLYEVNMAT